MNLRQYESAKFELAEILRAVSSSAQGVRDPNEAEVAEFFARLAEDRFNLVVAGRFSRGKTTLMNAILGMDRLPTGVLPLTSVVTRVVYGSRERLQIEFQSGGIEFEVPMETLAEYVTERGNPGNQRSIRTVTISLPAEILRRGFCFVDTPGLGSAIAANTRTTQEFLPQADAVILVSSYEGPLTEDELDLADLLARTNRRLFVVLNKADLAAAEVRREVDEYVRGRLQEVCGADLPRIFALSARDGLAAKLARDPAGIVTSGVGDFERALTSFLVDEKSSAFLRRMCDHLARLLDPIDARGDLSQLRARLSALSARIRSQPEGSSRHGTPRGSWSPRGKSEPGELAGVEPQAHEALSIRMDDCVICTRVVDALFDFLRQYQFDLVASRTERERLASAGGLCARHLWQYTSIASDRDLSVTLVPLAERVAEVLRATGSSPADMPGPSCVLCVVEKDAEARAVEDLVRQWGHRSAAVAGPEPVADPADPAEPSICLPHLRVLALESPSRLLAHALARRQSAAVERLAEDMQRYALKREGLRGGLASEEEEAAARRTVLFIAGHRTLAGPGRTGS